MRDKSLLSAGQSGLSPLLTDKETLAAERKVLKFFRSGALAGRLDLEALSLEGRDPEKSLQRRLANTSLTDGQRDAVLTSLSGASRVVGVQGYAGTGKTFMNETLRRNAEKAGYELEGLAPALSTEVGYSFHGIVGGRSLRRWAAGLTDGFME